MYHKNKKQRWFLVICVLPALAVTLYFMILPTIKVCIMSFFNVTATSTNQKFVGFDNFLYLIKDEYFISALQNTLKLMLIVPILTISMGLLLAVVITQSKLKERKLYRVILFMPSILSTTVIGILWSFIYHPNMGIVNFVLDKIGLDNLQRAWLGDSQVVLYAVAGVMVWIDMGYFMVMYIAGIDNIPSHLYEAAKIDGANQLKQFFYITIPMLWNLIRVTIVLCISSVLGTSFVLVKVMTNGGPSGSSSVLLQYMYDQAFKNANFGYAMSISVITLLMSFVLSKLSNWLTSRET